MRIALDAMGGDLAPKAAVEGAVAAARDFALEIVLIGLKDMVENELAIQGWQASTPKVRIVGTGGPLRAWRLPPGRYQFTATYHLSSSRTQLLATLAAFLLLLGSAACLWRRRISVAPRAA